MTAQSRDQQQEPSMEEILSSIRRIIADEEAEEGGKADERAEAGDVGTDAELADDADDLADDEDVLELTKMVRESGEVVDIKSHEAAAEPAPEPAASEDEEVEPAFEDVELAPSGREPEPFTSQDHNQEDRSAVPSHQAAAEKLLSDAAATAATGAFAKLSGAFQRTPAEDAVAEESGRTIEQFVEDIIRPLLRDWMDENLPKIVERLVQKEIQKIARRAELMD